MNKDQDFNPATNERVWQLLERYRTRRCLRARRELLERGASFVRGVTAKYSGFLLGDRADVANIGQLGLAKAIAKWRPSKAKTWLYYASLIIRSEIQTELNKQKRYVCEPQDARMPWLTCGEGDEQLPAPDSDQPDAHIESSDCFDYLLDDLSGLERQTIECIYWTGMDVAHTAEHLKTDTATVRRALSVGLQTLRGRIREKETLCDHIERRHRTRRETPTPWHNRLVASN